MKRLSAEYIITIVGVIFSIVSVILINSFMTNKTYKYEPIKVKEVDDKLIANEDAATSTTTTTTKVKQETPSENKKILSLGSEIIFDNLTKTELIDKLNKNLYDTMANTGTYFADYTEKTGLDPYLSVAIVNLESGCKWGCSYLTKYKYNIGGLQGSNGYLSFNSLEEGIDYYLDLLYKNYWLQGLTTPELMNSKYAASTEWARKVNNYMDAIKAS